MRIARTRFRFPESVEIDVVAPAIQYSGHKIAAVAETTEAGRKYQQAFTAKDAKDAKEIRGDTNLDTRTQGRRVRQTRIALCMPPGF